MESNGNNANLKTPMNELKKETSVRSPGVRRIHADIRELHLNKSKNYAARPCEDDLYDWHFSIRGPEGTDFAGGKYHGRIILPADYPFKPPHIIFLTPNGRWETGKRICLSISSYHPEEWSAAWGIRTVLEALISMMPTPAEGAVGAIDVSSEERKKLAAQSLKYKHPLMPELPDITEDDNNASSSSSTAELPKFFVHGIEPSASSSSTSSVTPISQISAQSESTTATAEQQEETKAEESLPLQASESISAPVQQEQTANSTPATLQQQTQTSSQPQITIDQIDIEEDATDHSLKFISWGLVFAILTIGYRKLLVSYAAVDFDSDEYQGEL